MSDPAGLDSASDFIKVSTGFAAGSLVYSVSLINSASSLSNVARISLFVAWVSLFAAIVTGVIASSRIPIKKAQRNYELEDRFLTTPTKLHQFTFASGIICLGLTLLFTLFNEPSATVHTVSSAANALAIAERCVPKGTAIKKVSMVESIKAIDGNRPSLVTWHVQFETMRQNTPKGNTLGKALTPPASVSPTSYLDVFVEAHSGLTTSVGPSSCPDAGDTYKRR